MQDFAFRYAVRETMGLAFMGVALFWSAGRLNWWPGWAALALMAGWSIAIAIVILRSNPQLLAERLGPRRGGKPGDVAIVSSMGLIQLARYVVAGLDQRFGWSDDFTVGAQLAALAVCILGHALFVWAVASNAYFSQIVRIQTERGHAVVSGGPYHYVRHPAYIASILFELGVAILLASWDALIASGFTTLLLILRTGLEDRTLQGELAGYAAYASQVRYRLIPGIW